MLESPAPGVPPCLAEVFGTTGGELAGEVMRSLREPRGAVDIVHGALVEHWLSEASARLGDPF
jgi:hypothetical protein